MKGRAEDMNKIRISSSGLKGVTVISNAFLDRFLPAANGDFIKVYLFLLRSLTDQVTELSLSSIADGMNCTENDIRRALNYWQKEGILVLDAAADGSVASITLTGSGASSDNGTFVEQEAAGEAKSAAVSDSRQLAGDKEKAEELPKPSSISTDRMEELRQRDDMKELFFVAEAYLGKMLSRSEMQRICFFYDVLHMPPELIEFLMEYCIGRGHTSFHYMEKVAVNWFDQKITSVEEARRSVRNYHREYYDILKALGIDNHNPVDAEIRIMKKWLESYRFPMDLIEEACSRTLLATSKPSLSYADGILTRWNKRGVLTVADVRALDEEHEAKNRGQRAANTQKPAKNSANDFEQRSYDYEDLEKQLLNSRS
jgi:DnaD/phage-associated family protein